MQDFTLDYYPEDRYITSANNWDPATAQWYNYGPTASNVPVSYRKSIAITP